MQTEHRTSSVRAVLALVTCALWIETAAIRGQEGRTERGPWAVDDIVMQERTTSWQLSPDGSKALFVRWKANRATDTHVPELVLIDLATEGDAKARTLTRGTASIGAPTFSGDGTKIYFLSNRKPQASSPEAKPPSGAQIWTFDLRGGEPSALTAIEHGVRSFQLLESGRFFVRAREGLTRREHKLKKDKDDTIVVEDPRQLADVGSALFSFDPDSKKLERLVATDEDLPSLAGFSASPDGRFVVTWHDVDPSFEAEGRHPPRWFLRDLSTGTVRELFADHKSKPMRVTWQLDSKGFVVRYPHGSVDGEDSAAVEYLAHFNAETGTRTNVDIDWEPGLGRAGLVVTQDGFIAGLAAGVHRKFARFTRTASGSFHRELLVGNPKENIFSLLKARADDRVIYVTGTASDPDHVFTATLKGAALEKAKEIYRPNAGFQTKMIAKTEITRWKGALDEEVEGIVYYPHDYRPGKRHPLVVITHGGPHSADRDQFSERWSNSPNLYAQRGAFVLKTNYHGSAGYGLAFGESIKARYYELEVHDILAGVQHLVDRGLVDKTRMGLVGWSNGAILSVACLTHAHLYAPQFDFEFRACAPGAGDVNWTSDYGNCAFGGVFDDFYLGGPPWDIPDVYIRKSPLFEVERVTTPTIIFFGTEDRAVPTSQGWEWYRALHSVGKAPVRFLLFPSAAHGLRKLSHQRRKLVEELAWLDRHLFETAKPEPVVPKGSPLDVAKRHLEFPRVGSRYGVRHEGHLVPETIPFGEVEVTRFEITVAQWQAFDATFARAVPESLRSWGNHPATGVTIEDANAYLAWLRETTDRPWRLPTEKELEKLAASSGASENTLDAWAGYAPPPNEARAIAGEIAKLPLSTALLVVGSRPPGKLGKGDAAKLIFDVGGNAAELATTKNGKVRAVGGSAIRSKDKRARASDPPANFAGLRLVVGDLPKEKPAPKNR